MSFSIKYRKSVVDGLSIFFILLFTYAAVNKLQRLEDFKTQLAQFPFIGDYAVVITWIVPAILIIISILFLKEKRRVTAFSISLLVMLLFIVYILIVLNFAESIPCSCAGIFNSWSWTEHLYFNIGILLLAGVGIFLSYSPREKIYKHRIKNSLESKNILLQQKQGRPKT